MSNCRYFAYEGHGVNAAESFNMSQSVRIPAGEQITLSGQGGWDRSNSQVPEDLEQEIRLAMENVDHALKDAEGKGMSQVYKLLIFYTHSNEEIFKHFPTIMKEWFPNHKPAMTVIGAGKLSLEGMRVEIDAWAHLG